MRLLYPLTEKKDKILSAHNQIDTGNLLSNVLTFRCCYGKIWLLDVRISCTEPQFCHWGPFAPKQIDRPGYVRYNTFFHAPKNNEGESNLTLITWFPHRRPLYYWMRLIKRFFFVTGLVILKLTQPFIPAENPNSSKFIGTEGVRD